MAHYRKLVRDKIPAHLDAKGIPYEKHIAGDTEYRTELIKKLTEEVEEFTEAGAITELADVLEVVDTLCALPEYTKVREVQRMKRQERGGFGERYILRGEK
jgi:predicted house-cleaning noncanonical NTP pyrophosphatase (MazG superfamily)